MASVSAKSSLADVSQAPPPPQGADVPGDYKPRRCRRCGRWSTEPAQYDQSVSAEKKWGSLIAWGAGKPPFGPTGNHCLLCKKA